MREGIKPWDKSALNQDLVLELLINSVESEIGTEVIFKALWNGKFLSCENMLVFKFIRFPRLSKF